MAQEYILNELKTIFKQINPKIDTDKVTPETRLVEDLGLDSLTILLMSFATIWHRLGKGQKYRPCNNKSPQGCSKRPCRASCISHRVWSRICNPLIQMLGKG